MGAGKLFQPQHVIAGLRGQVVELARGGDVLPPTGHLFVDRFGDADIPLRHRHVVGALAVHRVSDADRHGLQAGQYVELGQEVIGDPVDPGGVACDHRVEPTAAASPAGGHAEFAARLGQVLAHLVEQLGGERTGTDPGGARLQDAQHRGDARRPDARPDGRTTRGRIGRGDERIRAVIHVEQRALRSFEQHRLAVVECDVEQPAGVGDAMPETLGLRQQAVGHLFGYQRLAVVDLDQHLVLEFQCRFDLLGQRRLVEHIGDPYPDPGDLVLVTGPDAAAGGADLLATRVPLDHFVHGDVVRHQQVGVGGDQQAFGVDAAVLEPFELVEQHARVDDYAVADHIGDAGG